MHLRVAISLDLWAISLISMSFPPKLQKILSLRFFNLVCKILLLRTVFWSFSQLKVPLKKLEMPLIKFWRRKLPKFQDHQNQFWICCGKHILLVLKLIIHNHICQYPLEQSKNYKVVLHQTLQLSQFLFVQKFRLKLLLLRINSKTWLFQKSTFLKQVHKAMMQQEFCNFRLALIWYGPSQKVIKKLPKLLSKCLLVKLKRKSTMRQLRTFCWVMSIVWIHLTIKSLKSQWSILLKSQTL